MAAEDGQNKASLDYTILVTFWSTLISNLILVPITAGIYSTVSSTTTFGQMLGISLLNIPKSIVSEIYEELYVDPLIKNWIAARFYEAGWDSEAAEFWSMLVTSFREAIFGGASDLIKGMVGSQDINLEVSQDTNLDIYQQVVQRIEVIQEQKVKLENKKVWKSLVKKGALAGIGLTAASCIFGGSSLGVLTAALDVATDVAIDRLQTKFQLEILGEKLEEMVGELTKVRPDLAADITWVLNSPTVKIVPLLTNPLTTSASQVAFQSISPLSTFGVTEYYIQEIMKQKQEVIKENLDRLDGMVNSASDFNENSYEIVIL